MRQKKGPAADRAEADTRTNLVEYTNQSTPPPHKLSNPTIDNIWARIRQAIYWQVSEQTYRLHFAGSQADNLVDDILTIRIRDSLSVGWIYGRLMTIVERAAAIAGWPGLRVEFIGPEEEGSDE